MRRVFVRKKGAVELKRGDDGWFSYNEGSNKRSFLIQGGMLYSRWKSEVRNSEAEEYRLPLSKLERSVEGEKVVWRGTYGKDLIRNEAFFPLVIEEEGDIFRILNLERFQNVLNYHRKNIMTLPVHGYRIAEKRGFFIRFSIPPFEFEVAKNPESYSEHDWDLYVTCPKKGGVLKLCDLDVQPIQQPKEGGLSMAWELERAENDEGDCFIKWKETSQQVLVSRYEQVWVFLRDTVRKVAIKARGDYFFDEQLDLMNFSLIYLGGSERATLDFYVPKLYEG